MIVQNIDLSFFFLFKLFRESSNFSKEIFPRSVRVSKVTITPLNALNFDSGGPESIDRSFLDAKKLD